MTEKIKEILRLHKLWLDGDPQGRHANLRHADLHGADLRHANLRHANLRDADLRHANLRDADLHGADLRRADLRHANLRDADLRHANLRDANLRHADLRDADLYGADLRGADLRHADLHGADLDYSCLPLWCGGLGLNIDDRLAIQILYHLVSNVIDSTNTSAELKALLSSSTIITAANQFHRVNECGLLDACRQEDKNETQNLSD